ncbi:MAG: hypothetical protein WD552_03020 [Candidatus Paceibacterota bacterium]
MKTLTHSLLLKVSLAIVLAFGILFIYTLPAVDAQNLRPAERSTVEQADQTERADSDTGDVEGDGYGDSDDVDRASYNNSRSSRANVVGSDSGDDAVDDGEDDTDRANYNNTRSNRSTVVGDEAGDTDADGRADVSRHDPDFNDPDDDGDGVSDAAERAGYNNSRSNRSTLRAAAIKEIDKSSPTLSRLRGGDKSTPKLIESLRASGLLCPEDRCVATSSDAEEQILRLRVNAAEVRGASEDAKAEARARLAAADEVNDANDFGLRVAIAALDNESIEDIETDDEQTTVRFRTPARFLGFIPVDLRARVEADSDGERVRYPWYAFLASKEDNSSLRELATQIRADHDRLFFAAIEVEE